MLQAGSRAPEIENGGESLHQLLERTGFVLVAFFKVSCPTCQLTFPYLQRFADSGVALLGVSQDSSSATEAFRDRFGLRFPLWLDSAAAGYPASNAYGLTHVPSLFLVNSDGVIVQAVEGFSKTDLEGIASRFQFVPFSAAESVPAFRPG